MFKQLQDNMLYLFVDAGGTVKRTLLIISGFILVILGLVVAFYLGVNSFFAFERGDWDMFVLQFLGMQGGGLLLLYFGIRLIKS
jgi:hypothetical protein